MLTGHNGTLFGIWYMDIYIYICVFYIYAHIKLYECIYICIYVDGVLFIFRMTWDWALNPPRNPHISPAKNPYNPSLVPSARYPAIMNTPPPNVEYIVACACLPAPPPPHNGMVLVQGPTVTLQHQDLHV